MNSNASENSPIPPKIHRAIYSLLAVGFVTMVAATYFFFVPVGPRTSPERVIGVILKPFFSFIPFLLQYQIVRRFSDSRRSLIAILSLLGILVGTSVFLFLKTVFDPNYKYVAEKIFGLTHGEHFIIGWIFWSWVLTGVMFLVATLVDSRRNDES